jgi:glycine cleavage system H protein
MTGDPKDYLELTVDKFTFRIPRTIHYSDAGVWIRVEDNRARIGLSDFAQQINGDIAFANLMPPGTELAIGDEFGSIETVKVNVELPSPVTGRIVEVNPMLQDTPELINQDPYGQGWMVLVELNDPAGVFSGLLDADRYFDFAKAQAEAELKK